MLKESDERSNFTLKVEKGVIGVDEDRLKSVSVMEGDSVTLNIDSTEIQGIILTQWRFGDLGAVIAETVKNEVSYPYHTDIFRGRLQVDHQTGSLTIKNMRSKHSGLYKLHINHSTGSSSMAFSVTVYDSPPVIDFEMKSVMEGDSLTLHTDVTEPHGDELIVWRFGDDGKLIAKHDIEAKSSPLYDDTDERFRDRLQLNNTGSLTITNTRTTDSGLYTVKISSSSSSKQTLYKRFNVTASVSGLSSGGKAGIGIAVVVVLLVVILAAVFYNRHRIFKQKKQTENKVREPETVEMLPSNNKDVDGVNGQ
ncbi:hypothetical protein DPX16_8848 [Anabarilius grahami]|uniref:Ig-like domain-containing protein n=1 Tax=Anabarilius grahami TaxID=495550 RepID=A0A3N0YDW2_ANAGA|nr:hypothetical protein DPX16_8848 [Anabarilius grahami]